jgi:riboflavin biosynthesis pyrimidine reductase
MIVTIDAKELANRLATEHAEQRVHIVFDGKERVDKVERVVNHAHFNKLKDFYLDMILKGKHI